MKKLILILVVLLMAVSVGYSQNCTLNGTVTYKNLANTIMDDSITVVLLLNNVVYLTTTTDANGTYEFTNLPPNTYTVRTQCNKAWGGGNALDALLALRHFVGLTPPLTGINLLAADANGSGGTPGSVDGLAIVRRFTGSIPNFLPASDWVSQTFSLILTPGTTTQQDIKVLCRGDVNGSFIPF